MLAYVGRIHNLKDLKALEAEGEGERGDQALRCRPEHDCRRHLSGGARNDAFQGAENDSSEHGTDETVKARLPDSGLGFHVNVCDSFYIAPSSLGSGSYLNPKTRTPAPV